SDMVNGFLPLICIAERKRKTPAPAGPCRPARTGADSFRGTTLVRRPLTGRGLTGCCGAKARRIQPGAVTGTPGAGWAFKGLCLRGSKAIFRAPTPARFHRRGLSARVKKRVLSSSQPILYHGYYRGSGGICQQAGAAFFRRRPLTAAPGCANMKLTSRETNFISAGKPDENTSERAAHGGGHDPAAAGGAGARFLPHHHFDREGAVQPLPDAGLPAGAGVRGDGGGPLLPAGKQRAGGQTV